MNDRASNQTDRRRFLSWAVLGGALALAYGTFAAFIGRFLYPTRREGRWLFVTRDEELRRGGAHLFRTPGGSQVNVTLQGDEVVALSSVCPHLGCQVFWQPQNDRFFCPCHNGVFTPDGTAVAGPPAEAGQRLLRYPVRRDGGLVFIQVPEAELVQANRRSAAHEGHG